MFNRSLSGPQFRQDTMPLAVPLKVSPNEQIPAARSDLSHPQLMKPIWIGYIWIGYEMPSGSSPVRPFPRVCRKDWILHVHWTLEVDKKPCRQKCIVHSYYLSIDESITPSTKYAIIPSFSKKRSSQGISRNLEMAPASLPPLPFTLELHSYLITAAWSHGRHVGRPRVAKLGWHPVQFSQTKHQNTPKPEVFWNS